MKSVKLDSGAYQVTLDNGSMWLISFDAEFIGAEKWLCHCTTERGVSLDPKRTKRECLAELSRAK